MIVAQEKQKDHIQKTVAGMVVLYRPSDRHIRNLAVCCSQVDRLYVVDNSETGHFEQMRQEIPSYLLTQITYLPNHGNAGIARALNQGADAARKEGYALLLTMDQDTGMPPGTVSALCAVMSRLCAEGKKIGIVAAHAAPADALPPDYTVPDPDRIHVDYPLIVPTSGNLIRLDVHQAVGGFDEAYFIDDVDFEYCLKLKRNGYGVAWLPRVLLAHNWGTATHHDFLFWKNWVASHHAPIRRYYITRNRLFTLRRYSREFPEMKRPYRRMNREEWRGILFFEKQRLRKIAMAALGVCHFLIGRKGPL